MQHAEVDFKSAKNRPHTIHGCEVLSCVGAPSNMGCKFIQLTTKQTLWIIEGELSESFTAALRK